MENIPGTATAYLTEIEKLQVENEELGEELLIQTIKLMCVD